MYCYQADVEPGYALTDLARILGMTGQGVGYAVQRGELIGKENLGSFEAKRDARFG